MQQAVETSDLEVCHGDVVAFSDVTLKVAWGSSLAIVGPNGSGKSTLLETLAGLHRPRRGEYRIQERTPALVLQSSAIDESLPITVLDAVRLARFPTMGLFRRRSAADDQAVMDAIERVDLGHLAHKQLAQISGGERQRAMLAQGLAQGSDLLLLDEPMTGLDVTSRQIVLEALAHEVAADRSVVLATHSLQVARRCDAVLLLRTTPIAFGTPDSTLTDSHLRAAFGPTEGEWGEAPGSGES